MSDFEVAESDDTSEESPLNAFERFLIGIAIWPMVLLLGVGVPVSLLDTDQTFNKLGVFVLFMMSVGAGKRLWRFLVQGRFRAGVAFGVFGLLPTLVIGSALAAVAVGVSLNEASLDQLTSDTESVKLLESDEAETSAASASGSSPSALGLPNPSNSFAGCVDELHRQEAESRSMRNEALHILAREVGPELAEDAVQDVMLAVCEKYGEGKVRELRSYFFRSVSNVRSDLRKRKSRWKYCELDERHIPRCQHVYKSTDQLRLVRAAMCRIDDRQAFVIRKRLDGYAHKEIADEYGISAANSRRIFMDGKKALEKEVRKLSNCNSF